MEEKQSEWYSYNLVLSMKCSTSTSLQAIATWQIVLSKAEEDTEAFPGVLCKRGSQLDINGL